MSSYTPVVPYDQRQEGVLYIDNSTLKSAAQCSSLAVVRYVLGLATSEERATLKSGTAVHECLARFLMGGTVEEAMAEFDANYREWAEDNVAVGDRLAYTNVSRIMRYWLESHPTHTLPFKVAPEMVEIGFAYPLDDAGEFVFCGRLDAIATYNGASYVVEHKSTGRITRDWLAQYSLDSQLSGYVWAASQHSGLPVVGVFLNAIELSKLPESDRKCAKHGVVYAECGHLHSNAEMIVVQRTPEQLGEWRRTAIHLAKKYKDLLLRYKSLDAIHRVRMQGTFNGSCRFCAFADWCRGGRSAEFATANFVEERWSPFDRAAQAAHPTAKKP